MFKNPYILPLVGLVALGIMFSVQRRYSRLADADGADSSTVSVEVAVVKPELVTTFADPLVSSSVSATWEKFDNGRMGNAVTFPGKGFLEFDLDTVDTSIVAEKPIFSFIAVGNGDAKGDKYLFGIVVGSKCSSIGLFAGKDSKLLKPFPSDNPTLPLRVRLEWNKTEIVLYVNGRKWMALPAFDFANISAVRPFVLLDNFSVSDFRMYRE